MSDKYEYTQVIWEQVCTHSVLPTTCFASLTKHLESPWAEVDPVNFKIMEYI